MRSPGCAFMRLEAHSSLTRFVPQPCHALFIQAPYVVVPTYIRRHLFSWCTGKRHPVLAVSLRGPHAPVFPQTFALVMRVLGEVHIFVKDGN